MTVFINNTKQQPVIGRQSKDWQSFDGIISLDACMLMLDSGRSGLMQHTAYSGQNTSHIFLNSSDMGQSSDRTCSESSYDSDADIDAINQIETICINPVDNADGKVFADGGDVFIGSEDMLAKKIRQRVSGMLLRAVVLQVVIIAIWLLT